ncbi:hypothetical protein BRARA_A03121 [Brassica rapa]|uniref:Uncharacterized protein n=1 Tax=Brassica campestris TaxID=3711 RepID=A0A398AXT8_BRACM|nr:hypothetical protein BRARA_A03121 [Brassica rapa]
MFDHQISVILFLFLRKLICLSKSVYEAAIHFRKRCETSLIHLLKKEQSLVHYFFDNSHL